MKRASLTIAVAAILMLAANAQAAEYLSTANVTQADFVLYGFSTDGNPTDAPDFIEISSIIGTYDLDIPPQGGLWDIFVEGTIQLDFDKDGQPDAGCVVDPINLGQYPSSGPQTSWGPDEVPLPALTFEHDPYYLELHDLLLGFDVDLDGEYPSGAFGANAYADFRLSNDTNGNLGELNVILTILDNASGGGDGIIDGWISGQVTVTLVPEPPAVNLLAVSMVALMSLRRR